MLVPIVADHLDGVHGAVRAIAAGQGAGSAVAVTAPADALGVAGVGGEFFGHGVQSSRVGG